MASHTFGSSSKGPNHSVRSVGFPRARVYWSTRKEKIEPRYAWICISTSLRWVYVDLDAPNPLIEFSSFRGHFCLSLDRLKEAAVWEDVEKAVEPFDNRSGPGFVVHGQLKYPDKWRTKRRCVQLDIIFDTVEERNAVMEQVRICKSPWQLLHKRMKEGLLNSNFSEKVLKDLFNCVGKSTVTVEDRAHQKSSPAMGVLEEGAKGVNVLTGFVQAVATIVKKSLENSAPMVSKVAQDVNEYAKCVTVVSSVVQVVVITTKLVEMGKEMKRGIKEWPNIYARVQNLREAIVEKIALILHPDGDVDELLVKNMFEVQEELVDVVADVEEELMRDFGPIETVKRFWKASELKKIEGDLDRLKGLVLNVVQSSSIAQHSKTLKDIEKDVEELKQGLTKRNASAMEDIKREMKKLKQNTMEDIQRDLEKLNRNANPGTDLFKRYFDVPYLGSNLVFDFESRDNDGNFITPEGILLNSVLQLGEGKRGNLQGASALGTHGMGGVGKTTALKKICDEESVRTQFVDGVCFMQFGQDATLQKVREEMCRCVRNFGGIEVAKDMRSVPNLGDVVSRAAEWLKGKAVLLVCDDLWATGNNELGYVAELKNLLRDASKSGLLISTRDRVIARAVSSSPVSFECVEPQGSKAREILGRAAFGVDWQQTISKWDAGSEYAEILDVCGGLPLALGIAGSGVNLDYEDTKDEQNRKDASFAVKNYWGELKEGSVKQLRRANADYHRGGLEYVVEASLKLCEVWGRSEGRNYDMRRLFRSLCILEKQQFLPENTLKLFWGFEGLDEMEVREVVRKFANLNIMRRERVDKSVVKDEQFCVRLHDLVLELCKKMAVDEKKRWHIGLINAYRLVLEDGEVTEARARAWWKVKDDGHVSGNLSRHLIASGYWTELEALLCDARWTLRRYKMGGWAALDLDFNRLFAYQGGSEKQEIRELYSMIKSCWAQLRLNQSLLGFYAFGYFSKEERRGRNVAEYLKSVEEHIASPWLCPLTKCVFRADSREQSRWGFNGAIYDIAVSWSSERVVIASSTGIEVWPLWRHKELFRIPIDSAELALCVAISEDAKLIVSGHRDGTVRRWEAHTGGPVGEPMYNHGGSVNSVAIRGNLIVSGSSDGLLHCWNMSTGEVLGSALRGHENLVNSVAISADGKLIVSGSSDKTIRRWDADTGEAVGSPLQGHFKSVKSVAISSDSEVIVSGSQDGTIQRWRASTGEAIGELVHRENDLIDDVAISEDGKCIVSGSQTGEICVWDASSGEAIGSPLRGSGGEDEGEGVTVAVSREAKYILSSNYDRTVRLWDVSEQGNISEEHWPLDSRDKTSRISCATVSADGKLAVTGADNLVEMWDTSTGEAVGLLMAGGEVASVAISKDGMLIVSGGYDGTVRRWDASTGGFIGEPMYGHSHYVHAIVISDDGKLIVTASFDNTVRRWDATSGKAIGKPMEHSRSITELAISSDGSVIVSGHYDDNLLRWNAETGEKIGDPINIAGWIRDLVISNDGKIIGCGSQSSDNVQLVETATGESVGERMKWREGQHILDEMRRARLCGEQECDTIVRKDTFPLETEFRAVCPDKKKVVMHLHNGSLVVCERR